MIVDGAEIEEVLVMPLLFLYDQICSRSGHYFKISKLCLNDVLNVVFYPSYNFKSMHIFNIISSL